MPIYEVGCNLCTSQNPSYKIVDAKSEEHANEKHNNSPIHLEAQASWNSHVSEFNHGKDHN